jgi:hypothetical protein
MGHIAVFRDDLQARDGVAVSHNVIEYTWAILLDPFLDESSGLLATGGDDVPRKFVW